MDRESRKIKAYIYPVTSRNYSGIYNPYMDNFINSNGVYVNFLNENHPSGSGIFHLLKYLHKIDYLFLNWIEDLPEKKGGIIQAVVFLILLRLLKTFRVKVIWTLHNKASHSARNPFLKKRLFSALLKRSDIIITHSKEGISFAESRVPGIASRIFYFPHPVVPFKYRSNGIPEKKYDILIWGSLAPYKAIDVFLEYLSQNDLLDRYRILIAGKAVSAGFLSTIRKYENEHVIIRDQFIENEELAKLIQQSKVVLFTYAGDSVLSSGVLADSISYGGAVIGPRVGSFADMGEAGIIETYDSMEELMMLLEKADQMNVSDISEKTSGFINAHTWEEFSKAFNKRLKS
jgi:beta-1,4-mannosyltransferase